MPGRVVARSLCHDRRAAIGAVRHLEAGAHPQEAWAVADIDELPDDVPLYFSLEGRRGGPDGAVLSALGVTARPASVGPAPLRLLPGDVRRLSESATLRRSPFPPGLRGRARASAKRHRPGEPLVVDDRWARPVDGGHFADDKNERPAGPIRYGAPGRILSVRLPRLAPRAIAAPAAIPASASDPVRPGEPGKVARAPASPFRRRAS